jgi:hypothetical protein
MTFAKQDGGIGGGSMEASREPREALLPICRPTRHRAGKHAGVRVLLLLLAAKKTRNI